MTSKTLAVADLPATETSPLLPNDVTPTSLRIPRYQLYILCWARITQNWTDYAIFPFMPALLRFTGVPEAQVGYKAGLVDSSLAIAQFCAIIFWSRRSEKYGRKPVLCYCLAGMSLSALLFGFARSVWQMVLFRTLAGAFQASSL
jgi:MFS family permease